MLGSKFHRKNIVFQNAPGKAAALWLQDRKNQVWAAEEAIEKGLAIKLYDIKAVHALGRDGEIKDFEITTGALKESTRVPQHARAKSLGNAKAQGNNFEQFQEQFTIVTTSRVYNLYASTWTECQHWVRLLKLVIEMCKYNVIFSEVNVYDFEKLLKARAK